MIIYATPVIGIVYLIQCFSDLTVTKMWSKANKATYTLIVTVHEKVKKLFHLFSIWPTVNSKGICRGLVIPKNCF